MIYSTWNPKSLLSLNKSASFEINLYYYMYIDNVQLKRQLEIYSKDKLNYSSGSLAWSINSNWIEMSLSAACGAALYSECVCTVLKKLQAKRLAPCNPQLNV